MALASNLGRRCHTSWVRIDLPKAVEWLAAEQNATDDDDIGRDDKTKANVDADLVIGKSRLGSLALILFYMQINLP